MVRVNAQVDQAALDKLTTILAAVETKAPKEVARQTLRASLDLCRSLKPQTKVAPKRMRAHEYAAAVATTPPKYLTYRKHKKLQRPLHRWSFTRHVGTPNAKTELSFVYVHSRMSKRGKISRDIAGERRELLFGTSWHKGKAYINEKVRGLARKAWGWVAKQLYGAATVGDISWHRRQGEKRDPRNFVHGNFSTAVAGAKSSVSADIANHLDYAAAAMKPGGLETAIERASNSLAHKLKSEIGDIFDK